MNDTTFKIDATAKEKIYGVLQAEAMKTFVQSVKDASDTGTFEVLITTEDIDRSGEVIKLDGWDFSNYMKSPVVLWGHNYQEPPIGICLSLEKVNNGIKATGKFAPTEFAQNIRKLYDLGMCRATSVGFIPLEMEGNIITKAELLEFSFVSVPANPYALSLRRSFELPQETASLIVKGIMKVIKDNEPAPEPAPEPEKPADAPAPEPTPEPTSEPKPEEKGAVADDLAAQEAMEQKYENLDTLFEIVWAMSDVYCKPETPVEDFNKLLTETIGILQTVVDGTYEAPQMDEKAVKELKDKIEAAKVERSKTVTIKISALKALIEKSDEGDQGDGVDPKNNDNAPTHEPTENGIAEARSILKNVASILGDSLGALREVNKRSGGLY